jgi:hypothetical protein
MFSKYLGSAMRDRTQEEVDESADAQRDGHGRIIKPWYYVVAGSYDEYNKYCIRTKDPRTLTIAGNTIYITDDCTLMLAGCAVDKKMRVVYVGTFNKLRDFENIKQEMFRLTGIPFEDSIFAEANETGKV